MATATLVGQDVLSCYCYMTTIANIDDIGRWEVRGGIQNAKSLDAIVRDFDDVSFNDRTIFLITVSFRRGAAIRHMFRPNFSLVQPNCSA